MAEYDKIAEAYSSNETAITKEYCLAPSFLKNLGNLKGKKVLDVACGSGYFTRKIKLLGATKVIGVDVSGAMIDLANQEEKKNPLGITYLKKDVTKMDKIEEFDIVVATFLLHYAKTKRELLSMCENIAKNLKRGGRFVAINDNPNYVNPVSKKYYVRHNISKNIKDGDRWTINLLDKDYKVNLSFDVYRWSIITYENALKKCGMDHIEWLNPEVSKEIKTKFKDDFWDEYLSTPPIVFISAVKK